MVLLLVELAGAIICFARAAWLKTKYIIHYAICLEYMTVRGFSSSPLYEYEIMDNGEKKVYTNWGSACFYPKVGKRYKVLLRKDDYNKVVAYNEYVTSMVEGIVFVVLFLFNNMN